MPSTSHAACAEQHAHDGSGSSTAEAGSLLVGQCDEAAAAWDFQAAVKQWRAAAAAPEPAGQSTSAQQAGLHDSDSSSQGAGGGVAGRLLHGSYDEAGAARDFRAAVQQWRQQTAGKVTSLATGSTTTSSGDSAGG